MFRIQTSKIVEHPKIISFPHYDGMSQRFNYNLNLFIDDDVTPNTISGVSTLEAPFSPIGYSGNSYSGAYQFWNNRLIQEAQSYYTNYVRPFMVDTSFLSDNYITVYKLFYFRFLEVLNYIKLSYYDISVGDDEPGDTWKTARFFGIIPNFKSSCYRTKIVYGINKTKLNIITTNDSPTKVRCYFINQNENIMTLYFTVNIDGEHKEIDPESGEIIRNPIHDSKSIEYQIVIN